jgi:hypothetical protein
MTVAAALWFAQFHSGFGRIVVAMTLPMSAPPEPWKVR